MTAFLNFGPRPTLAAGGGFQEVYRHIFSGPTVDLNAANSVVTLDGVAWRTPSVTTNGQNMVPAATSFEKTSTGLAIVGANNASVNPGNITGNVIFASLAAVAANDETPFAPDCRRTYVIEAYVDSTNADANDEWSGVAIFRPDVATPLAGGLPGNAALYRCGFGFGNTLGPGALVAAGGTSIAPPELVYDASALTPALADPNVPYVHFTSPQSVQFGGSPWNTTTDDFPAAGTQQGYGTARDPTDVENDIVLHPVFGFFFAVGHCAENLSATLNANIPGFRILQGG